MKKPLIIVAALIMSAATSFSRTNGNNSPSLSLTCETEASVCAMPSVLSAQSGDSGQQAASQQDGAKKPDTKAFLKRYQNLVIRMEQAHAKANVTRDSIYAWKDERTLIKRLYNDTYKHLLTDDEVETYFAISTDYKKQRAEMNLDKMGENIDNTMRRTGKKISGWFGGSKKK